ncbi:hypothetical protein HXX76_002371 [Chlamydomonas incerta]|uniref:Uncharacterized protein n=1 Tax=Chlamydomonas incerta TaxID=51695 RepID=A0A835W7H3_CHLIN|nr:hypothetical protein HXX76_002371 [Chlamydomonas incerta]|eukprot:KAG2442285.1 hypothetical protein HXX76_002371 [Chlamydomonas incerta]
MLVSEVWPDRVASVLLDQPQVFVDFFTGPSGARRILLWFSHFSMDGMRAFKFGARALAHYALEHRDEVWDLLRWEGKHAQAPVAVAQKTHYFCELAVVPSVMALLGGTGGRGGSGREGGVTSTAAGFLSSAQWRECCTDGAFLELDRRHFCRLLLSQLRGGGARAARLTALLRNFLAAQSSESPWQLLCQRLLHQLTERQLLDLINTLAAGQPLEPPPDAAAAAVAAMAPPAPVASSKAAHAAKAAEAAASRPAAALVVAAVVPACAGVCGAGGWQDLSALVLAGGVQWSGLGEVVLAHALAAARGPLQRLLAEEAEEPGVSGKLAELEGLAAELHAAAVLAAKPSSGGNTDGCSAEEQAALLHGQPQLQRRHARQPLLLPLLGRRSGPQRLLLLAELWTLREVLRGAAAPPPRAELASSAGLTPSVPGGSSHWPGAAEVLERVMAEVGGVSCQRLDLLAAQEGPGVAAGGGGEGAAGVGVAPEPVQLHAAGTTGAAAGAKGTGVAAMGLGAGSYELLASDDEDRSRSQRKDRKKSKHRKRRRKDEKERRRKSGSKRHRHRRRARSESPGSSSRGSSRSRSSRSGGSSRSRSPPAREPAKVGHGAVLEADPAAVRNAADIVRQEPEACRSPAAAAVRDRHHGGQISRERSGSSAPEPGTQQPAQQSKPLPLDYNPSGSKGGRKHGQRSRRHSRSRSRSRSWSRSGDRDSRPQRRRRSSARSTTLYIKASDSDAASGEDSEDAELRQLDPLTALQGGRFHVAVAAARATPVAAGAAQAVRAAGAAAAGAARLPGAPGQGGDAGAGRRQQNGVWRVRLGFMSGRHVSVQGGAQPGTTAAAAAAGAGIEVVGGCDDVADLLAAMACKHWATALLATEPSDGR